MSWSRITGGNNGGADFVSGTTVAKTLAGAVSVGDLIIVEITRGATSNDLSSDTCADNLGNTYIKGGQGYEPVSAGGLAWFYCFVTSAGTPTITVTFPSTQPNRVIVAHVYRSTAGAPVFDSQYTTPITQDLLAGSPDNLLTGTAVTPAQGGSLIVAGFGNFSNYDTFSAGTGFTEDQDSGVAYISYAALESLFPAAATPQQGVGSNSGALGRYLGFVAAFRESSGSGGGTAGPRKMMMVGCG